MKKILLFSIFLFFLIGCETDKASLSTPKPLYPQPTTSNLNTTNGYIKNQLTKDSISLLINSFGDTILTGKLIPIHETKAIGSKSIPSQAGKQKNTLSNNSNLSSVVIPDIFEIDTSLIQNINYGFGELSFVLTNNIGDTIKTGVPLHITPSSKPFSHPKPTKSLPPIIKESAINNLQNIDVDQGLVSSYIYCSLIDKEGQLWLGTYTGVSCFDGTFITNYTEKEGLTNNQVQSMLEDIEGNLWFGTIGGGIYKYNGDSLVTFNESNGLNNNSILSIYQDRQGIIWFGTNGGGVSKFDGKNFTYITTKEGLTNNIVTSILEDKFGNIWFGTHGGGASCFSGKSFKNLSKTNGFLSNYILSMSEDKNGNIWFGTYGNGVIKYNQKKYIHYTKQHGLSGNNVRHIMEDKDGDLWFGSDTGGATKFNGKSFYNLTTDNGLSNISVRTIIEDNEGHIWLGTFGGGINKYEKNTFTNYTTANGLSNNTILSIQESINGDLLLATYGNGANLYNGQTFTQLSTNEGLSKNYILSIFEDQSGNIWLGTQNSGLNKYDGEKITHYTTKEGLSHNFILSIYQDSKENIWIGTSGGGVTKINGETFTHLTEKEGLTNNIVRSIIEDKNGNMWFGTESGLSMYNGTTIIHYTEREGLSHNSIYTLTEDTHGNIWIGTYGGGINKFDGTSFTYITQKEGLSNDIIYSITEDENENMWVTTESGLNKISFKDSASIQIITYGKRDGLKALDFYMNSSCLDSKNKLWWGTGKGLTSVDLENYTPSATVRKPELRQLDINEQFIDYHSSIDSLTDELDFNTIVPFQNYPKNLELPYTKNHLTFHFSSTNFSSPHKLKYSYILEGLNTSWSKPSIEPKANYRNIPYGNFTFKVSAIGENNVWSKPFEYNFTITPPWWHTIYARVVFTLISILIILLIFRVRTNKLKQRQKELEEEVKRATKEIREQKEEVELVHKEITDSINYAKRLQNAILPSFDEVNKYIPKNFIYFQPKDVVSGDFYWFEHINNISLIAVADCTGHGVPGAMVSVVCSNALHRTVHEFNITEPSKILDKTRELVIETFAKSGEKVKDGMDIALCAINDENVIFSGGNNPLWIVRETILLTDIQKNSKHTIIINKMALIEFKPNKQPIGLYELMTPFTQEEIQLFDNDVLYFFTDGYADQFGGKKGKKLKYKPFKKLLIEVSQKPIDEQKQIISKRFQDWMGNLEQIDDVCVIAIKL